MPAQAGISSHQCFPRPHPRRIAAGVRPDRISGRRGAGLRFRAAVFMPEVDAVCRPRTARTVAGYGLPMGKSLPTDLEPLDRFLMSDQSPPDCMLLSDLDGFLTGLVVGPELILPSEWLPVVWGGDEPEFDSLEQAQTVLGAIMARYNDIARGLEEAEEELAPIYWQTRDGEVVMADWASGFMEAVGLRADTWLELINDDEAGVLLVPILALCADEEDNDVLDIDLSEDPEAAREVGAMLPKCVAAIHEYWRDRRQSAAETIMATSVAPDAPCPCGSGKVYKDCHGVRH